MATERVVDVGERAAAMFSASSTSLNAPGNSRWLQQVAPLQILGNVGRDILNGPRLFANNASLVRRFSITERIKLEFRAEAFNLTNTPEFDLPDMPLGDAAFGQITTGAWQPVGADESEPVVAGEFAVDVLKCSRFTYVSRSDKPTGRE
jgi:hypothetical protein